MKYQPIIGLEVHVELETLSKMFCGCPADHFGKEPNAQTCPVCLGLPGALPVPNKKAVEWTIMLALALDCKIAEKSWFDRKNYFYPDLPKGFQISQHFVPFGTGGHLDKIRIHDVHLEEDTGKLSHQGNETLIDFNRSGVPLVEIVTEPDFRSIEEVDVYLKKLQRLIRYLNISHADMEKGSMRLEPSISLKSPDDKLPIPNYRVELKNINSFRFARRALEYEINRQTDLLDRGESVVQQTRGWSETKNATVPQREKEEAHDYRYFPEPDIPPMHFSPEQIAQIRKQIPELPQAKMARFMDKYGLSEYTANILVEDQQQAQTFEETLIKETDFTAQEVANSIVNNRPLTKRSIQVIPDETITQVIQENSQAVNDYKAGKVDAIGVLIGKLRQKAGFINEPAIAKLKSLL